MLNKYIDYMKKVANYKQVVTLMHWDLKTKTPENGANDMAETLTYFSTKLFELTTSDEYERLINELLLEENFRELPDYWQESVKKTKERIKKNKRIPVDFYNEFVKACTLSEIAWEKAKRNNDYSIYEPHLQKMIDMVKQKAKYEEPDKEVYDTLLDTYEEGITAQDIDKAFNAVKEAVVPLIEEIKGRPAFNRNLLKAYYDIDEQKHLQDFLLKYIGFDFKSGATGVSEHPFTLNLTNKDVRVTNHYNSDEGIDAIFSAIHEGGHGIFEQNVDDKYRYTESEGIEYLGLHESQSRFYENILGRRKAFWEPIYEEVQNICKGFKNIDLDTFVAAINDVRPSYIRTQADEVTYCLHIILRYELEREIFINGATAKELPELWRKKSKELLGIVPETDALGVLQDMHWSDGSFGYFPTYLLGSIYDGMILERVEESFGNVDEILRKGDILKITRWLNENIHQFGGRYNSKKVLKRLGYNEIDTKQLIKYFYDKHHKE